MFVVVDSLPADLSLTYGVVIYFYFASVALDYLGLNGLDKRQRG